MVSAHPEAAAAVGARASVPGRRLQPTSIVAVWLPRPAGVSGESELERLQRARCVRAAGD
jgi:hypothetical protein